MERLRIHPTARKVIFVAAGLWFGGAAEVLLEAALSEAHYKQHMWHHLGQGDRFTNPHMTLFTNPKLPGSTATSLPYSAAQDVTISGQRYELLFRSDDPELPARASRYAKNLPTHDSEEIEATSSNSKRMGLLKLAQWALAIPIALIVVGAFLLFAYRALQAKSHAPD